ncbi:MAG: YIP1 family protein [Alphaproteobacteria bacterium]
MLKKIKSKIKKVFDVVFSPKRHFSKIVADGNIEDAMFNAFTYGMLGGILVMILRICSGATFTFGALFNAIIIIPVLAVTLLFLFGGLLMFVSEITGGERDWEIAIKGLASVFFIYPAILVFNALAFNCWSVWMISILADAWILFLFYNIVVYCMHAKRNSALIVCGIVALFLIMVYCTDYHVGWLMLKNQSATLACLI